MYEVYLDGKQLYYPGDKVNALSNAVLNTKLNDSGTFECTIPITNPLYDKFQPRVSELKVVKNGKEIWNGEIRSNKYDFKKQNVVKAVGELAYLTASSQPQKAYSNVNPLQMFTALINKHNAQVEPRKQFEVGIVTVGYYNYDWVTNYEDTLDFMRSELCDKLNGYLRIRKVDGKRYLDLVSLEDYGKSCTQPIEFGENMLDYATGITADSIATVVRPLGTTLENGKIDGIDSYLTIESVNNGKDYLENIEAIESGIGYVWRTVHFNDLTDTAELKAAGENWLKDNQFANMTIDVTAVDLSDLDSNIEEFDLGDSVRTIAKPFGMDKWSYITEKKVDLLNPVTKHNISIGESIKQSYTQQIANEQSNIKKEMPQKSAILDLAKNNASELIKNATEGNIYTVYDENRNPKELLIMDTNDIKTAKKVWRWNVNGLAYSSTGYDGEYKLAMTIDGAFVADFITTGTLSADRIRGGTFVSESDGKIVSIGKGIVSFSDSSEIKCSYESDDGDAEATAIAFSVNPNHTGIFMNIAASDLKISSDHIYIKATGNLPYEFPLEIDAITKFLKTAYIKSGAVITSDKDCKTDISELDCEKTAKFIYSLKPSQFKYTDGTSDRFHHGLIAQEVKESMGEDDWGLYVDTNPSKEGNKGLRYEELITDLIATVQTQNERIKQLERIINE